MSEKNIIFTKKTLLTTSAMFTLMGISAKNAQAEAVDSSEKVNQQIEQPENSPKDAVEITEEQALPENEEASQKQTEEINEKEQENAEKIEKNEEAEEPSEAPSKPITLNLPTAETMYEEVIRAKTATEAWLAAQDFKASYQGHEKLMSAFEAAGRRIYDMAKSNANKGNTKVARSFYTWLYEEELVPETMRAEAQLYLQGAEKPTQVASADSMYQAVVDAKTATESWLAAQELKENYPADGRLGAAFEAAGDRIYRMAITNHQKGNFASAITYYSMLVNEEHLPQSMRKLAGTYLEKAGAGEKIATADLMLEEVLNAKTASEAWLAAQEFKSIYSGHEKISEVFAAAGQRIYDLGVSNHRKKNYKQAITYYSMVVEESAVPSKIQDLAKVYLVQAQAGQPLATASTMYQAVVNAKTATESWLAAEDFKASFPKSSLLSDAFAEAGQRIYDLGLTNHRKGQYKQAANYYSMLTKEDKVPAAMREEATVYLAQANNKQKLSTAENMYQSVLKAKNATSAWNEAEKFKTYFPSHKKVAAAFESAGERIYAMGVSNHRNKKYSAARSYYQLIINEKKVSNSLRNKAVGFNEQAEKNYPYTTAKQFYTQSINGKTASDAWYKAHDGLSFFPNDEQLIKAVNKAGQRVLNLGVSNHKKRKFSSALSYYNMLLKSEFVDYSLNARAESYKYLADKKYDLSNIIIRETNYNVSLNEMISIQMNRSPQMSKQGGGWRNATKAEVEKYVNPGNTVNSNDYLQYLVLSGSSGISVNDLNTELKSAGILKGHGKTFQQASREANINEIYLIAHALLETGNGSSKLATGIKVNGKTVYNMFGIGAVDSDPERLGAKTAYEQGWFTVEDAIIGGAKWISSSYINNPYYKQDTLYKMRWNPLQPGTHQYATDVAWAYKQTNRLTTLLDLSLKYDLLLNFSLPEYRE